MLSEIGRGDPALLKGRTWDHFSRIIIGSVGRVDCWKPTCTRMHLCDFCWELGTPERDRRRLETLQGAPPPAARERTDRGERGKVRGKGVKSRGFPIPGPEREGGRGGGPPRGGAGAGELRGSESSSVEVRDLSVVFSSSGRTVGPLDGLSLSVAPSEFVCIVGPNGSGKTTLLNVVAGFVRPVSGEVLVGGEPVLGRGMDRGIVFQEYALFPWRTAVKNVEFGLETLGVRAKERRETAMSYLALVGLEGFAGTYPHQLSGGMKQRVAIARALAYDPSILLMDEPFAALDALTREKLQRLMERIWAETRKTILYVTHSLTEAIILADRVLVLSAPGRARERNIDLPRPRNRHGAAFAGVRQDLRRFLQHPGPSQSVEGHA